MKEIKLKTCSRCKELKISTDFHRDSTRKDGLDSICKDCSKQKYMENRKNKIAYQKEYRKTHKEQISKYLKNYQDNHRKIKTNECARCGDLYEIYWEGGTKYCNRCREELHKTKEPLNMTCVICSAAFKSTMPHAIYCEHCRKIKRREMYRRNSKIYRQRHIEEVKEVQRQQWITCRENRPQKQCEICGSDLESKYYTFHYCNNCKSKMANLSTRRRGAKRKRLGYKTLNLPFQNSDGHHINQNEVMFIPKELHQGVRHNVFSWENMNIINALAWKWFFENEL